MMHPSRTSVGKMSPTSLSLVSHVCVKQEVLAPTEFNYLLEQEAEASYKGLSRCLGILFNFQNPCKSEFCIRDWQPLPKRQSGPVTTFIKLCNHCVWQLTPRAKTAKQCKCYSAPSWESCSQHLSLPQTGWKSILHVGKHTWLIHWDKRVLSGPWVYSTLLGV